MSTDRWIDHHVGGSQGNGRLRTVPSGSHSSTELRWLGKSVTLSMTMTSRTLRRESC